MIYNVPRWVLFGANGAAWLPNISLIAYDLVGPDRVETVNHEAIHITQQIEFSPTNEWTWEGYLKWLWAYFVDWLANGYDGCKFEIDAYRWESDITNRPAEWWRTCQDS